MVPSGPGFTGSLPQPRLPAKEVEIGGPGGGSPTKAAMKAAKAALEDELDSVPDRPEALHPSQTHVASRNAIAAGGPPCHAMS